MALFHGNAKLIDTKDLINCYKRFIGKILRFELSDGSILVFTLYQIIRCASSFSTVLCF